MNPAVAAPETPRAGWAVPGWALLRKWGGFVKFSHTVFALPFALASMMIAAREHRGWPGWRIFGLILAAMVAARTCAMAFNRIADRDFDRLNPRTARRDLPAGRITLASAWVLCLLSGLGLVAVSYWINPLCFALSPVALGVICFYSLTKRFTDFTHPFLGLALAIAPVGAWLAVTGRFALPPLWLALIVVGWLTGFDTIYAIQDYEFDRRHRLHSIVVRWGPDNALKFAFLVHMITWGLLFGLGLFLRFRFAYLIGLLLILASLLFEHWLARLRSLKWINTAFFRLNALISLIFLVVVTIEVVFPGFRIIR